MLVSRRIFLALGAVWLSLSVLEVSPALAGPTVTVRVEGESSTLLPLTSVKLESPEPVSGCPASSATAAINLAVNGDWDHGDEDGSKGDFTETILGETHIFEDNGTTWDVWVNDRWGGGICEDLLNEGEEVLLVADHLGANFAPERLPLVLSGAPTTVDAGTSFTVDVNKIFLAHGGEKVGEGEPKPEEGVTVSGGGASATTGADGAATLTLTNTGPVTLRATKAGDAPSASIVVCVHNGNDGTCGTTAPTTSSASTSTSGATTPATGVAGFAKSAPYTGPYALVA
ncbi:MAG TPA: hypothetical protein VK252_03900, partial [Solirubrobacteraceae bacterium]|nr:hypothetical protein [Solirubrobacteraceae bacterium]